MSAIGDRMKRYESVTQHLLTNRMPVIIRVDGRSFHSFTRKMNRPFDQLFINNMELAMKYCADDMQGFKAAYCQSDEISFLITDFDELTTEGWFSYKLLKIVSTAAALATASFVRSYPDVDTLPTFDARAFNVPREDVANYFLWRCKDWGRNSLQMYARSFFSHKSLHKKSAADMHEMLHKIDKNWATDLTERTKNGSWYVNGKFDYTIKPDFESVNKIISPLFEENEA